MTSALHATLLYSMFPVVATTIGGVVAAYTPSLARWRGLILYFAAGVVFSVVAVELLPEIIRHAQVSAVVTGFTLGVAVMLSVRTLTARLSGEGPSASDGTTENPAGLLVAVGVDFLLDGLLLGIGFAAGAKIGILLALAETAEQLAVGLALAGELVKAGATRSRAALITAGLSLLVFVTAIGGATTLSGLSAAWTEGVLSFGLAALLFLVTEELLREAQEEPETLMATAMFFVGFLLFLIIGIKVE